MLGLGRWRERMWWIGGGLLLGVGLVYLLRSVFAILFVSAALAYLLDPVVDRFEERGYSRERIIFGLFGLTGLALTLSVLILLPLIAREFQELAGNVTAYVAQLQTWGQSLHHELETQLGRPLPVSPNEILAEMRAALLSAEGGFGESLREAAPNVGRWFAGLLTSTLSGGISFAVAVLNLAMLPIFTFYLLRDWDRLVGMIRRLIPRGYRERSGRVAVQIDERLGSFVRGQLTVCAALGVLYSIGLVISGIDLALVVGLLSGLLFIIPYLGTIVGVVLATALAVLKFGFDWHLIAVWITFGGVQLFEGMVLTPTVMGDKVGLHPMVVIVALLVGGNLFGLWGMLLAIPVTAAGEVMLREWIREYRASAFFEGDD